MKLSEADPASKDISGNYDTPVISGRLCPYEAYVLQTESTDILRPQ